MQRTPHDLRVEPLDDALLLFEPASGLNVRVDGPRTRGLRRRAPRTVLFGLTTACNLDCSFCHRDRHAPSRWTVDSAHKLLVDLSQRGVLEVAFGGGEPFVFRDFPVLLERLARDTRLALNVTTNGTLVTPAVAALIAPLVGEVRLSVYEGQEWHLPLVALMEAGVRTGVNLLVAPGKLEALAAQLEQVRKLGCRDAALLRYVGPESHRALSADDEQRLAELIHASPLSLRVASCFADRLPQVPRLFPEADCGAGDEFVSITPDGKVRQCSFQRDGVPFADANELLATWEATRAARRRAPGIGCGRRPGVPDSPDQLSSGLRVWQGYSSNNSGECVLVGRFETTAQSRDFVQHLRGLLVPGAAYSDELLAHLAARGVPVSQHEFAPEVMEQSGRAVLMYTATTLTDDFAALRTLLWREGGHVLRSSHRDNSLVSALRFDHAESLARSSSALEQLRVPTARRGMTLFALHDWEDFPVLRRATSRMSSECVDASSALRQALATALQQRGSTEGTWLFATFGSSEEAQRCASNGAQVVGPYLVLRSDRVRPRDGYIIHAHGGRAVVIHGPRLELSFSLRGEADPEAVASDLKVELGPAQRPFVTSAHGLVNGSVLTDAPAQVLSMLRSFAQARELSLWVDAQAERPLAHVVARLEADVSD